MQIVGSSELVRLGILLAKTLANNHERPKGRKEGEKGKRDDEIITGQKKWDVGKNVEDLERKSEKLTRKERMNDKHFNGRRRGRSNKNGQ